MNSRGLIGVVRTAGLWVAVVALVVASLATGGAPVSAAGDQTVNITFLHVAPFADSIERSKVNVRIDGVEVASDVPYKEQVTGLTLEPGSHEVVVEPTAWPEATYTETIDIPAASPGLVDPGYMLVYAGGAADIWFHVDVVPFEQEPPASGAQIRFVHYAPYSIDKESEYTICRADGSTFFGITMYNYGKVSPYQVIPAGTYGPLYIAGSHVGCSKANALTTDITITFADGSVADFVAIGTNASPHPTKAFRNELEVFSVQTTAGPSAVLATPEVYLPITVN